MLQSVLPDLKFQTCVNFTKSETCYHLHFCHACLNLLIDELVVAQCSYFVKHYEWIPAMYFVAMFVWCSIIILMHLDGYLLFIADRAIFVLLAISKPCIRFRCSLYRFQAKSPHLSSGTLGFPSWGQVQSSFVKSCICITYRIPHSIPCLHHVVWAFARGWLCSFCLFALFG